MGEWVSIPLEDLVDDITVGFVGSMTQEYVESGIPFLRSKNVEPYRINFDDIRYIDSNFHQRIKKSALSPGDVVIVRTGKPGSAAIIPESLLVANCSDLVVVRPGSKIDKHFLVYYLNSIAVRHINSRLVGAVQQHFNIGAARELKIYCPPIEEQRAIAAALSCLDRKIENLRKQNETLEKIAQTLFKHWFVDFEFPFDFSQGKPDPNGKPYKSSGGPMKPSELGKIPANWRVGALGNEIETLGGGTPSTKEPNYWVDGDVPWYSPTDLTKSKTLFSLSSEKKITKQGLTKSSAKLFPAYSILLTSRATIGEITINTQPACTNQGFITLIPNERFSVYFLYGWLLTQIKLIKQLASGSTFPELSKSTFRKFLFLIPGSRHLEQYNQAIQPPFEKIENNIRQIQTLTKTRDALLPKLMSGKLRITS